MSSAGFMFTVAQMYFIIAVIGGILALILFFFPLGEMLDFFNPLEWVLSITILGAVGYIGESYTSYSSLSVFFLALGIAIISHLLIHFFIITPLENAESSLVYSEKELIGKLAEVYISIPENGYGEIVISSPSGTKSMMAASFEKVAITAESKVVIVNVVEAVAHVSLFENTED